MPLYRILKARRHDAPHKHEMARKDHQEFKLDAVIVIVDTALGRYLAGLAAKDQHRRYAAELVTGGVR